MVARTASAWNINRIVALRAKEASKAQYQHSIKAQSERAWLKGALAGFVATGPMTLFMLITQRFLPKGQRYDLPPEIITKELARRAHVRQHLNKGQILAATLVSHFGYGAAMGALYSPFRKEDIAACCCERASFWPGGVGRQLSRITSAPWYVGIRQK